MEQVKTFIRQIIHISDDELSQLLNNCAVKTFQRNEILSEPGKEPNELFFINSGLLRVIVNDKTGVDHTVYFAMENQFVADYSAFILKQPSLYTLQAVEQTEVVLIPRSAIEWGYKHLKEGDKLGRLIAEFYFIYHDNYIKNQYSRTPKERYESISEVFPNIHNRVPQHMIASYLGITSVHLSRLKKQLLKT